MSKKDFKEQQRERQIKLQKAEEAKQKRKEAEAKKNPRRLPKKKMFLGILLIVLVVGVILVWQFGIKTYTTITIMSDGTIDPSTAPISKLDNGRYTFTADIFGSIIINQDNIVIDGANHRLYGETDTNSTGIQLDGRTNVTITNLKVNNYQYGIFIKSGSNIVISQNDLTNEYGIAFDTCSNSTLIENTVSELLWSYFVSSIIKQSDN